MEKLNRGTTGGGDDDDEEPENRLQEKVGVGTGVKKVGGSGTSTAGNDNTSSASDTSTESVGSDTTGTSSGSGPATNDEPAVTTPGGGEAVQPGGGQSGSSSENSSTSTTDSGGTDGGRRDLDPLEVQEAASESGAGAGTDAGGGGSGSTNTPPTDAPDMTGPGGQQRAGTQPSTQSAESEDNISDRRKSEIKGQVMLENSELFDTGPGDEDGGRFDSDDIVVSQNEEGEITARISESARREVARENYISSLTRGDAADELDAPGATVERTDAAAQREESRELVRERFQSGEFDESDVEVQVTEEGTVAGLSSEAQREIVVDRIVEKSPKVGPDAPLGREDVIVRESDDGQITALVAPGAAQDASAGGEFGEMTATGLDIDSSPAVTGKTDGVASGRSPGLDAGERQFRPRGEQFGDADWSAALDLIEAKTGADVPYGGNPERDEVEEAVDKWGEQKSEWLNENWTGGVKSDAQSRLNEPVDGAPSSSLYNPRSRLSAAAAYQGANLLEEAPNAPGDFLEAAETAGYLTSNAFGVGLAAKQKDRQEAQRNIEEAEWAGRRIVSSGVNFAEENPMQAGAATGFIVGSELVAQRVIRRASRVGSRGRSGGSRTSAFDDVDDEEIPDDVDREDLVSDERGPPKAAGTDASSRFNLRTAVGRARSRASSLRERGPEVEIVHEPDAGAFEIDPILKKQVRNRADRTPNPVEVVRNRASNAAERASGAASRARNIDRQDIVEPVSSGASRLARVNDDGPMWRSDMFGSPISKTVDDAAPSTVALHYVRPNARWPMTRSAERLARGADYILNEKLPDPNTTTAISRRIRSGLSPVSDRIDTTKIRDGVTELRSRGRQLIVPQWRIGDSRDGLIQPVQRLRGGASRVSDRIDSAELPDGVSELRSRGRQLIVPQWRIGDSRDGLIQPVQRLRGGAGRISDGVGRVAESNKIAMWPYTRSKVFGSPIARTVDDTAPSERIIKGASRLADVDSDDIATRVSNARDYSLFIGSFEPNKPGFAMQIEDVPFDGEFVIGRVDDGDADARGTSTAGIDGDETDTPDGDSIEEFDTEIESSAPAAGQSQKSLARLNQLEPDSSPTGAVDDVTPDRTLRDAGIGGPLGAAAVGELGEGAGVVEGESDLAAGVTEPTIDTEAATAAEVTPDAASIGDIGVRQTTESFSDVIPGQMTEVASAGATTQEMKARALLRELTEEKQRSRLVYGMASVGTPRPRFDLGAAGGPGDSDDGDGSPGLGPIEETDADLTPGWLSENATTIATRGLGAPESPSQDTLEERPGGEQLTGELPTQMQLQGGEEIEQVSEFFGGYGVDGDDGDDGENPFFDGGDDGDGFFEFDL